MGGAGGGDLIKAVRAMHNPGMGGAKLGQRLGKGAAPFAVKDADHDALNQRRIGKRPQQIEDGANAKIGTHRPDMAHRRMMTRGHQKTDPGLGKSALNQRHLAVKIDLKAGQHIGSPAFGGDRPIAMFGDRNAAASNDKGGGGGDIVGADAITTGANNIHRPGRCVNGGGLGAHDAGGGGDILDTLPTHFQGNKKGRHLNLADLALHDRIKTALDDVRSRHLAFNFLAVNLLAVNKGQQRGFHYVSHDAIQSKGSNRAYKQV